ncbi:hypothetical protein [Nocardioides sp. InS609-2]|uniref:hypothetical protein n=1 Tax=Nocardioides sp. InS609-2 TaxID=2760705 RepID=UPI0020C11AC3|nr:hypothetical protein [Nocardioides sp. InS609-2]
MVDDNAPSAGEHHRRTTQQDLDPSQHGREPDRPDHDHHQPHPEHDEDRATDGVVVEEGVDQDGGQLAHEEHGRRVPPDPVQGRRAAGHGARDAAVAHAPPELR